MREKEKIQEQEIRGETRDVEAELSLRREVAEQLRGILSEYITKARTVGFREKDDFSDIAFYAFRLATIDPERFSAKDYLQEEELKQLQSFLTEDVQKRIKSPYLSRPMVAELGSLHRLFNEEPDFNAETLDALQKGIQEEYFGELSRHDVRDAANWAFYNNLLFPHGVKLPKPEHLEEIEDYFRQNYNSDVANKNPVALSESIMFLDFLKKQKPDNAGPVL